MLSPRSALLAFLLPVTAFRDFPTICVWDPPIEVVAGDNLSARISNPLARRCEASLSFDDPAFLPIRYTFDTLECDGLQLAEFIIPPTVPNGDAFALWQCSGTESTSCAHVSIMNGTGTLDVYEGHGAIGCITERRQSTATLITSTSAGIPVTLTLPTVTTITETSFALTINVIPTDQALAVSAMSQDPATITNAAEVPDTTVVPGTSPVPGPVTTSNAAAAPAVAAPPDTAAAATGVTNTAPIPAAAITTALTTTATLNGTSQVTDTSHWTTTTRRSNVVATLSNDPSSNPLTTNPSVAPTVLAASNGGDQLTSSGTGAAAATRSDSRSSATALAATGGTGGTQFLSNTDAFQVGVMSSQAPNTRPPTMAAAITTLTIMVTSIMREACTTQTSA